SDEQKVATGLNAEEKDWLVSLLGPRVQFDVPMRRHTTLAVGGPADAVAMPADIKALTMLLSGARQRAITWLIIGGGSNLLVRDGGIRGIVIALTPYFKGITTIDHGPGNVRVRAKAGTRLQTLCRYAIEQGLAGMTFALGIPGSVGGAIAMNAGTADGCIGDVLETIMVLWATGRLQRLSRTDLNFGYRRLSLPTPEITTGQRQGVIIDGTFMFPRTDFRQLRVSVQKIKEERKQRQPVGVSSAGCFFKNPPSGPSAGELIDKAGLKGKRLGGAEISSRHGNFIINRGNARAADILALAEIIETRVAAKFGVQLEPEVIITGESNHASKSV
ncbi:MAG: UDP-N-acetylmuramate dehydrogenase, partial [Thermodesulfobacteriota bacterium]|nr:UDP-N-acetylmuramate dehydrogenase [Thermodesulfobacteriota bacterium]